MDDLLLAPPSSAVTNRRARKRGGFGEAPESGFASSLPTALPDLQKSFLSENETSRLDMPSSSVGIASEENIDDISKSGDSLEKSDQKNGRVKFAATAEEKEHAQVLQRMKEAKARGEEVVLGFSVKDEEVLESGHMLRRRLFPVGFDQWAKNVKEVNVTAASPYSKRELGAFLVFCLAMILFVVFCIFPTILFEETRALQAAIFTEAYFPHRTHNITLPRESTVPLLEQWGDFNSVYSLDEFEAWLYQVVPGNIIPVVYQFNNLIGGIRLTQRRMLLSNNDPRPLHGSYHDRWASTSLSPDSSFNARVEDTTSIGPYLYNRYGGYKDLGGFVVWINGTNPEAAQNILMEMSQNHFFDRKTAAVTLEFLISNLFLPVLARVVLRISVTPSGLLKKTVAFNLIGTFMQGADLTRIIICAFAFISMCGIIYFPFIAIKRNGFMKWMRKRGISELLSIATCIICSSVALILFIVELISFSGALDVTSPKSSISTWGELFRTLNGFNLLSQNDNKLFNSIAESFSVLNMLQTFRAVFLSIAVFSIAFRLVQYVGYFLSYRATVIVWVARYFLFPAFTVFCFLIFFTIGFGVMSYANFGVSMEEYSTYSLSFLNSVAGNFGDWVKNGAVFWIPSSWAFVQLNLFFIICYYGMTFLMLALLIQGYETVKIMSNAAEDMDLQIEPLRREEKLYRYNWFKVKARGYECYQYLSSIILQLCCRTKMTVEDLQLPEHHTDNLSFDQENDDVFADPIDYTGTSSVENQHVFMDAYEYVDESGNIQWNYDPYFLDYDNNEEANQPSNKTLRWDWYDPYTPPSDWKPEKDITDLQINKSNAASFGGVTYPGGINSEMKQQVLALEISKINKEYFKDIEFSMTGTGSKPNVHNIHSYAKSRKTRHTWLQLIGIVLLVLSSIFLVPFTFIQPRQAFLFKSAVQKALLSATWSKTVATLFHNDFQTPKRNYEAIRSVGDVLNWIEFGLRFILIPADSRQSSVVFKPSISPTDSYPTLLTPWGCGLSQQSVQLSVFEIPNRYTVESIYDESNDIWHLLQTSVNGPYVTVLPQRLKNLGFQPNPFTDGFHRYFPNSETGLLPLLHDLSHKEFIVETTVKLEISMLVLDVNTKQLNYFRLILEFLTTGLIVPTLRIAEIHPMFLSQLSKLFTEPIIIIFCCVIIISLAGEVHGFVHLFRTEQRLRQRVAYLRSHQSGSRTKRTLPTPEQLPPTLSIHEGLMIYICEQSVIDTAAILLMLILFSLFIWGTKESNFEFDVPIETKLMDELHHRMGDAILFTNLLKIVLSWLICFSILRLCSLLRDDKRFGVITLSILSFLWDFLFAFAIIFALAIGFGFVMFTAFGQNVYEFRTFTSSLLSCCWIITGQFNFRVMFSSYPYLSLLLIFPLWALLYITFLNIFTAIFVRSFSARIAEVEEAERLGFGSKTSFVSSSISFCKWLCKRLGLTRRANREKGFADPTDIISPTDTQSDLPLLLPKQPGNERLKKEKKLENVLLPEDILQKTRLVQMSDKAYETLSHSTRLWAEEQILQLIDRFRKLDLGLQVFGASTDNKDGDQRFVADLENRLYTELTSNFRDLKLAEGKLRHRLNVYDHIAKEEQDEFTRYILFLENAIEETEADIKEAKEEYDKLMKPKNTDHLS